MAHQICQTGITACNDLRNALAKCKSGHVRIAKIGIKNEQLVLVLTKPPSRSWEDDYDTLMLPCLGETEPCYILYRLDTRDQTGNSNWLFICYTPEQSSVRLKTLYSGTRATLRQELEHNKFKLIDELVGTVPADVCLSGYKQHIQARGDPRPLTENERTLEIIRQNEERMKSTPKRQMITAIEFPLTEAAIEKLKDMKAGNINYIQLSLDTVNNVIKLEAAENIPVEDLTKIPAARYHFYNFQHVHQVHGTKLNSIVFLYTIPNRTKERVLYSSSQMPLIHYAEQKLGIVIAKKIESDDPKEITKDFLIEKLHS